MKFSWEGTVRVGAIIIAFIALGLIGWAISTSYVTMRYANRGDINEIQEHQVEIYKMLEAVNRQIGQVHADYQRVGHYISGHDFHHPTDFCPVCSMLYDLNKRKEELNQRTIILSEEQEELKQSGLKDSKEYKDKTAEINKIMAELGLLNKYLFNEDERAIEVNKIMRKQRLIGGNFSPDPKGG